MQNATTSGRHVEKTTHVNLNGVRPDCVVEEVFARLKASVEENLATRFRTSKTDDRPMQIVVSGVHAADPDRVVLGKVVLNSSAIADAREHLVSHTGRTLVDFHNVTIVDGLRLREVVVKNGVSAREMSDGRMAVENAGTWHALTRESWADWFNSVEDTADPEGDVAFHEWVQDVGDQLVPVANGLYLERRGVTAP